MSQECELLETCGFFSKYKDSKDLACRGFLTQYCTGPKMDLCKRREYRMQNGRAPSDDMMPNGLMISEN